ncbi:MAG: hypothetical protein ACYCYP_02210 [Leptospirales bacterium]
MDIESRVTLWNQYFQIQGSFAGGMIEPWKSYGLNDLSGRLLALVSFLKGDREAIDRYETAAFKAIEQIRESQRLLKEALGEEKAKTLDNAPLGREHPDEQEKMKGLTYAMLTGIPDVQEAQAFLESLIGSPVEACAGCGRLFVSGRKNKRLCAGCGGKGQDEAAPRRKAYRQVFMAFKRRLDKGLSPESAKQALLQEKKYADLIRQWNLDLSDWT